MHALALALSVTLATTAPIGTVYTAYTPNGGTAIVYSIDDTRHDDDTVILFDQLGADYVASTTTHYTLYTIEHGEIVEMWGYEDTIFDWQTWALPTVQNTIQF